MKNKLALLLSVVSVFSLGNLVACGGTTETTAAPSAEAATSAATEEATTEEDDTGKVVITYHYNCSEIADSKTKLEPGKRSVEPTTEREGYELFGWYTDEALTQKYVFGEKVNESFDLYARWGKLETFEAEGLDVTNIYTPVYSGTSRGKDVIIADRYNMGASGGYYLMAQYSMDSSEYNTTLTYTITATEATTDAHLYLRLSAAYKELTINGNTYQVNVNGVTYNYQDISFTKKEGADTYSAFTDFQDYLISSAVSLQAGDNTISLVVNNSDSLGGTTKATAPCLDCIKIATANGSVSWGEGFPKDNSNERE